MQVLVQERAWVHLNVFVHGLDHLDLGKMNLRVFKHLQGTSGCFLAISFLLQGSTLAGIEIGIFLDSLLIQLLQLESG